MLSQVFTLVKKLTYFCFLQCQIDDVLDNREEVDSKDLCPYWGMDSICAAALMIQKRSIENLIEEEEETLKVDDTVLFDE